MTNKSLKIAFMGTPDFAVSALQSLINSEHEVVCVYSRAPRPKGRGHKLQKSPIHNLAEGYNIPVFTPKTFKNKEVQEEFIAQNIDVAIVAAYGLILPRSILDAPKYGCLNIHGSLLPRWRGASPIQRAIWAGDKQSGITIMQMDEGLDTGNMIAKCEIDLNSDMTSSKLHDELAEMGAKLIVKVLDNLLRDGELKSEKQNESKFTYAKLLKKSDGNIDWAQNALQIDRQIRAFNPWPGVRGCIHGINFKVLEAAISNQNHNIDAGTILSKNGEIACGDNSVLKLLKIQPEGKNPMDFVSAINGGYIKLP